MFFDLQIVSMRRPYPALHQTVVQVPDPHGADLHAALAGVAPFLLDILRSQSPGGEDQNQVLGVIEEFSRLPPPILPTLEPALIEPWTQATFLGKRQYLPRSLFPIRTRIGDETAAIGPIWFGDSRHCFS